MPFCAEGAKRHYKGLTIDGIFWVVYSRLELHVGAEIALCRARVVYVCVFCTYVISIVPRACLQLTYVAMAILRKRSRFMKITLLCAAHATIKFS